MAISFSKEEASIRRYNGLLYVIEKEAAEEAAFLWPATRYDPNDPIFQQGGKQSSEYSYFSALF